jgi:hypothetical protein
MWWEICNCDKSPKHPFPPLQCPVLFGTRWKHVAFNLCSSYNYNRLVCVIYSLVRFSSDFMTTDEAAGTWHTTSPCYLIWSKERTVIIDMIQKCVGECNEGELLAPVTYPDNRAPFYTGASLRANGRVRKQGLDTFKGALSPNKKTAKQERNFHRQLW